LAEGRSRFFSIDPDLSGRSRAVVVKGGQQMATSIQPHHEASGGGQQGQLVDGSAPTVPPTLPASLINEPAQANPMASTTVTGPLQYLIGTWTNQPLAGSGSGGPYDPYSYNLMILPQVDPSSPAGYILKSMPYYEEITFTAVHGSAANRGGLGTQVSYAILYEQRVYISAGPAKDMLVHFENGIWGYLDDQQQLLGPYGDGEGPNLGNEVIAASKPPTQEYPLFKQISVPHGNSVLACGRFASGDGAPAIGMPQQVTPFITDQAPPFAPNQPLPAGFDLCAYGTQSVGNPIPDFTLNPNLPLSNALAAAGANKVANYIEISVDSTNGGGGLTNIGFEQQHCDVLQYSATYWLEMLQGSSEYTQLQYSQTIMMQIPITLEGGDGPTNVIFPHITTNTLTRVQSSASEG
jgi:hypothetical protein